MQLFTNKNQTRFFVVDSAAESLSPIEVNSVKDLISTYPVCTPLTLLGWGELRVSKSNEITTDLQVGTEQNPVFAPSFIANLNEAEITIQILDTLNFDEQISVVRELRNGWTFDDDYEEDTESLCFTTDDGSQLTISINDATKSMSYESVGG